MIYVPGRGPNSAKLVVVGEAPGADEERLGYPFAGKTGKIVRDCFNDLGTDLDYHYTTNVVKVRPPGNDISKLFLLGKKIEDFIPQLWDELDAINPNCILAFGNTALEALTGEKGIENYRGSILPTWKGRYKVVPTIHPAALLHSASEGMSSWADLHVIKWDIARALQQSKFPGINAPIRNLHIAKSNLELYRFFNRFQDHSFVSSDIETLKTIPICISFAFNREEAISVPLFNLGNADFEVTRTDICQNWKDIVEFMADTKKFKIGQNWKFDGGQLSLCNDRRLNFGVLVRSFYFDTLLANRTLYPELPGSLAFTTSIFTEEPYYKEEGKGYNPKKDKVDRLLLYNAKDSVCTFEVYEEQLKELRKRGLEDFFFTRVMPLHGFYSRLESRGIRRDETVRRALDLKYKERQEKEQSELNSLASTFGVNEVNVNSNGINNQVGKLIFLHMGIPMRKGTDEKTLDAIKRNVLKGNSPEVGKKRRILELIGSLRKLRKTRGTYINALANDDGRIRTSVRIMLESGRTSTGILKPPVTTVKMGLALQTLTKHGEIGADIREEFIPDPGYVFIEPDLSQAEARVVAILARDKKLQLMFEYGIDVHCVTSYWIRNLVVPRLDEFFISPNKELAIEINSIIKKNTTEEQRQMGKKFRHAGHYNMGKHEASVQTGLPEKFTDVILKQFHRSNENIQKEFHEGVKKALADNGRKLVNPFGRERLFMNRWGDELFKEAYAQIPQSTVSDQTKFAAMRIERRAPWLEILLECHDSFLSQAPLCTGEQYPFKLIDKTLPIIREELEVPIDFSKCSLGEGTLVIPSDIKIGKKNWLEMEKVL